MKQIHIIRPVVCPFCLHLNQNPRNLNCEKCGLYLPATGKIV